MDQKYFIQVYDSYHITRSVLIILSLVIVTLFFVILLKDVFFTISIFSFLFILILYHYFTFVYKISISQKGLSLHKLLKTTLLNENIINCKQPTARLIAELKRTPQVGISNIFGWSGIYSANDQNYFVYSSSTKYKDNILIQYGLDNFIISANNADELLSLLNHNNPLIF